MTAEREARIKAVVGKLAHEVPELADLDAANLEKVARVVLLDEIKSKLRKAGEVHECPMECCTPREKVVE